MHLHDEDYPFDEKPKKKPSEDAITWAQAWQAIGVFLLVLAGVSLINILIQSIFMADTYKQFMGIIASQNRYNPVSSILTNYEPSVSSFVRNLPLELAFGLLGIFIIHGLGHFIALFYGGVGTLRGLIVRANTWMIITCCLFAIGNIVLNYFLITNVVSFMGTMQYYQEFNEYLSSQLAPSYIVYAAIWLFWSIGMSNVVGNYYKIGGGKGCLWVLSLNSTLYAIYSVLSIGVGAMIYALISNS